MKIYKKFDCTMNKNIVHILGGRIKSMHSAFKYKCVVPQAGWYSDNTMFVFRWYLDGILVSLPTILTTTYMAFLSLSRKCYKVPNKGPEKLM
jgi:hypothetical protein